MFNGSLLPNQVQNSQLPSLGDLHNGLSNAMDNDDAQRTAQLANALGEPSKNESRPQATFLTKLYAYVIILSPARALTHFILAFPSFVWSLSPDYLHSCRSSSQPDPAAVNSVLSQCGNHRIYGRFAPKFDIAATVTYNYGGSRRLLERPENHHMIRWDAAGEHIIVERPEQLALHVLPSVYRQSRFASFSRQLNVRILFCFPPSFACFHLSPPERSHWLPHSCAPDGLIPTSDLWLYAQGQSAKHRLYNRRSRRKHLVYVPRFPRLRP